MKRTPEPEMMLNTEHCQQYFEYPRQPILDVVLNLIPDGATGTLADLGTGPGQFPKLLHEKCPSLEIDAYDGSAAMLEIAYHHVGETDKIELLHKDFRTLSKQYDYVVSIFTLHQIHDPDTFWQAVEKASKDDSEIMVLDLVRPESEDSLNRIVEFTKTKTPVPSYFEADFRNSLNAAFTIEEIKQQVNHLPLEVHELKNPDAVDDFSLVLIKTVPKFNFMSE
jgi:ubiquinone/menaquinone biosynthesis C-methylase UbiE